MHRVTTFFSSVLVLLLILNVSTGFSQGDEHTTLVGRLDLGEFIGDIWGYTDTATGIDYALVGALGGMAIIDATTDSDNPTLVAYVTGVSSGWKDIKTWKNYSYLVSEGGGGLEIVDLTDPTSPVLVQNHTTDFTNAHNLYIDENGFAYVVGANAANGGMIIYDLADPENPVKTGEWAINYIHDVFVRNNIAWASLIGSGELAVIDVTAKTNPATIIRWFEGSATHQSWLTDDGNYLLATEERTGGHLKIWDVRDLNNITLISEYESKHNMIIHNVYVRGVFAYLSYYAEGLKVIDISDPTSPAEVGDFDTTPESEVASVGVWGVFPYTSSGLIYVSDKMTGFYSARFDGTRAGHLKGTIRNDVTGSPIANAVVKVVETGSVIRSNDLGKYKFATVKNSLTLIGNSYGYFPDTSSIVLISGDTVISDFLLTELPKNSISGVVTDALSGLPIQADIFLTVESDAASDIELEVSTDVSGAFSFESIYISYENVVVYRYLVVLPEFPYAQYREENLTVSEAAPTVLNVTLEPADILLFDADEVGDYIGNYIDPLDSLRVTFQLAGRNNGDLLPVSRLNELNFPVVIWFTGDLTESVITATDEDSLLSFLDAGGRLFLTGQNIVENLSTTSRLLTDYLQVSYGGESFTPEAREVESNPITSGVGKFLLTGTGGPNNQTSLDILNPTGSSKAALYYSSSGENVAALSVENTLSGSKIFLTGFGFEGIEDNNNLFSKPYDLMARVLNWFELDIAITGAKDEDLLVPAEYSLEQNYPNPFNPTTMISFSLKEDAEVTLVVYSILGNKVATVYSGRAGPGRHEFEWNGRSDDGIAVSSGIYLYRLEVGVNSLTRKMVLLK